MKIIILCLCLSGCALCSDHGYVVEHAPTVVNHHDLYPESATYVQHNAHHR